MGNINNIVGGVSPLKKGEEGAGSGKSITRKRHAGDVGRRATATRAQDRSGYSRSGADYINVHSFTGNTRLGPSLVNALRSSSASLTDALKGKGDKGDKGGIREWIRKIDEDLKKDDITYEEYQDPDEKIKVEREIEGYNDFWDNRISDKSKWSPGMQRYLKNVDLSDPAAVQKAYDGWEDESIRGKSKRDAEYKTSYKTVAGQKYKRQMKNGVPVTGENTDAEGWYKVIEK